MPTRLLGGLPNLAMSGGEHDRRVEHLVEYSLSGDHTRLDPFRILQVRGVYVDRGSLIV